MVHNPLPSGHAICQVAFDSDPPSAGVLASDSGRSAADTIVQDQLTGIGVSAYQIFEQGDGFLCGMDSHACRSTLNERERG